jgi:ATP-dependent DNA helicase Rep
MAVAYIDGPLLVLAGAGSGKTSVITHKIAYLIQKCGYEAKHIAAVTFTNKASREMKERVDQLLSGPGARELKVNTFHQLGLGIIRREHKALGLKPGFSIFDNQDSQTLIKDILLQEHGNDGGQSDFIQQQISNWKNDAISPEDAIAQAYGPAEILCSQTYQRYNHALRAYNALDFDDLILRPSQLFQQQPEILIKWQQRIRYVLVDEYQDTNGSQYNLIKQLVGIGTRLTVVGDDDQSIYAWRGARPENLANLQQDYPGLKVVKLEQNYRSTARLLKAANQLISNNPHVFNKVLWSDLGFGEPIRVIECSDEEAEAEQVVAEILDHKLRHQSELADYAILYRGNHQSRRLELCLQSHQVAYTISEGTSFFAHNEIKDIMAYLKLLINPDDDNAFLRIANTPRRKIGTTTLETLVEYAHRQEFSLHAACSEISQQQISESAVMRLRKFRLWLDDVARNCEYYNPVEAIRKMIDNMDYYGWIDQNSSSTAITERRIANVELLIVSLAQVLQQDEGSTIQDAIGRLVLHDLLEQQEEESDGAGVQLMTLHASKGLEFPHVYLVGMEEELLPHRVSIKEDNIEEERRLAYVGITRAQETLTMTFANKRKQFGGSVDCESSRFLDELPREDILWLGNNSEQSRSQNQDRGLQTISSLQDLFS